MSDAWDLTDLQILGRDPDLETLLCNRGFDRQCDTGFCGFHVCINTNVVTKTQQGCVLYVAYAMAAWQHPLLGTVVFCSFQAYILVHLKC